MWHDLTNIASRRLLEDENEESVAGFEQRVGLAFGVTFAAGAFTLIGSFFVFLSKKTVSNFIGLCLGIAAGVIAYEGMIELYGEAIAKFKAWHTLQGMTSDMNRYAHWMTLGLFSAGWLTTQVVAIFSKWYRARSDPKAAEEEDSILEVVDQLNQEKAAEGATAPLKKKEEEDPNAVNERGRTKAQEAEYQKEMLETGMITAIVMFMHNLPEGLAVFFATLSGSGLGFGVAVAIGLHNIPQGFSVALPIFEATGDRWKAFNWSVLSGVSQPFASVIGWFALRGVVSNYLYGITFAYAAGMMSYVVIKVLLPAAFRTDPKDALVTWSFLAGLLAISVSLGFFDES